MSRKPALRPMLLIVLLLPLLQACAHLPQTVATSSTNSGCIAFQRLTFDRLKDTLPTIQGIKDYDAARDAICGIGR